MQPPQPVPARWGPDVPCPSAPPAGHETKALLNNSGPRYKRSKLERQMNCDVLWCVLLLVCMSLFSAIGECPARVTSACVPLDRLLARVPSGCSDVRLHACPRLGLEGCLHQHGPHGDA